MKLLNGLELAGFIKERQAHEARSLLQSKGIRPKLAIIRTNPDPVVDSYMKLKQGYGEDIGVEVDVRTIEQSEALALIKQLNTDETVHGIIVQIPLPDPTQTTEILNAVSPFKDVDGLRSEDAPWPLLSSAMQGTGEQWTEPYHKYGEGTAQSAMQQSAGNASSILSSAREQAGVVHGSRFDPATPMAINWLLAGYNVELRGKNIVIVGHGRLVGRPLKRMWEQSELPVTVADKSTENLAEVTREADVLVCATGVPGLITVDMVKSTAVIVDAGVATDSNGLVGDVAADVRELPDIKITPEKGGVGPLTVCALFENVIRAAGNTI